MQRLAGVSFLLIMFAFPAMAQDTPAPKTQGAPPSTSQDKPAGKTHSGSNAATTEISGGFTLHHYYDPSGNTLDMNGWYGDVEHNIFQRWLGVEIQAAGAFKNQGAQGDLRIYTITAGPAIYPFGHRKVTPFAHFLAGEGYYRNSIPAIGGFPAKVNSYTSFAWTGGGGLDLAISRHWAVRLAQFDYTKTNFIGGTLHESDTRISFGVVYRFGGK